MDPLALYLHWPYCARICPYCDFNVVRARGRDAEQARLGDALLADLKAQAARLGPRRLVSIFFGGGTPSLMAPGQVQALVDAATGLFAVADDLEVTLEANPTDAEAARYRDFARAGVNRLSLGVQALDDASLKFLGRDHDAAEALRASDTARAAFERLSIDLIYARPEQTAEAWGVELKAALAIGPEHVSPYQLTIEPGTAFDRAVGRGRFTPPEEDAAAGLFETTQAVLEGAGFHAYEVSNHALGEAARSRHNLAIWRGAEYLGVGPGAHGRAAFEGVRTATRGAPAIGDYLRRVAETGAGLDTAEPLSPLDAAEERLMLGLRIEEGAPLAEVAALSLDPARTAPLVEAGLIKLDEQRIAATPEGRLVLNRLLQELLV